MSNVNIAWRTAMRDLMRENRMSYRELSRITNVHHTTLWRKIAREDPVSLDEADQLLAHLGGGVEIRSRGGRRPFLVMRRGTDKVLGLVVARSSDEAASLYLRSYQRAEAIDVTGVDTGTLRVIRFAE
jgi:hypothetical protein